MSVILFKCTYNSIALTSHIDVAFTSKDVFDGVANIVE